MTLKGYSIGGIYMFGSMFENLPQAHQYYMHSTGTGLKDQTFNTRLDAEICMHNYCNQHGIHIECTEYDKHERKYSDHNGVRFYINRI